jgi:hypothetical protein
MDIAGTPANFHAHVLTVGPAQLLQPLQERRHASLSFGIVRGYAHQYANAPHSIGLLRARRERPRNCRAAEQADEIAPFRSTTLHSPPEPRVRDRITDWRGSSQGFPAVRDLACLPPRPL